MRKISVNEVQDGMVLAREIQDEKGRILLKRGDGLRAAYISKLQGWGVTEVCIETPAEKPAEASQGVSVAAEAATPVSEIVVPPELTAKYERLLEAKFAGFSSNWIMATIRKVAVRNLAYKEARGETVAEE